MLQRFFIYNALNVSKVVLVSLLLTLNRIHTLFWYFYYWLWVIKCPLRLDDFKNASFSEQNLQNFQNIIYFVFRKLYSCTRNTYFFRTGIRDNAGVLETAKDDVRQRTSIWWVRVRDKILEYGHTRLRDFWRPDTTVNITIIKQTNKNEIPVGFH